MLSDWLTDRWIDGWTDWWTEGVMDWGTEGLTDWKTDEMTDWLIDWLTDWVMIDWLINLIFLTLAFQNTRHSLTGPSPEYRLKEKYFLRKIEINNLNDTEGKYHTRHYLSCSRSQRRQLSVHTYFHFVILLIINSSTLLYSWLFLYATVAYYRNCFESSVNLNAM